MLFDKSSVHIRKKTACASFVTSYFPCQSPEGTTRTYRSCSASQEPPLILPRAQDPVSAPQDCASLPQQCCSRNRVQLPTFLWWKAHANFVCLWVPFIVSATNYMFQISHWLQLDARKLASFDCQISVSTIQRSRISALLCYKTK